MVFFPDTLGAGGAGKDGLFRQAEVLPEGETHDPASPRPEGRSQAVHRIPVAVGTECPPPLDGHRRGGCPGRNGERSP